MGLGVGDAVLVDDGDGDGGAYGAGKKFESVSCSICLETVTDNGDRSWAKLQCGHEFHLDCIGSAFNIKGTMQCPNCRKIEKGQWLYANGCRTTPEFSMEDWAHEEDLYDLGYSEMSFGVHWCPFGSLARLPSSFEEGDFSSNTYPDVMGQQLYAEHAAAVSSATNSCPYIAYVAHGQLPSSSHSNASISDGSHFNNHNHWNRQSMPGELPNSYAFPSMDLRYHGWDHHPLPFSSGSRINGSDPPLIPPANQRSVRMGSDISRSGSFMHPFLVNHSSTARAGSSVASSMAPHYQGSNARARDRVQALQAYYQQQQPGNSSAIRTPVVSGPRRSTNHRIVSQGGPIASSSDQNRNGFYFFQSGGSTRNLQEVERNVWERDQSSLFPQNLVDGSPSFREYYHAIAGEEVASLRQAHGIDRSSSQNR